VPDGVFAGVFLSIAKGVMKTKAGFIRLAQFRHPAGRTPDGGVPGLLRGPSSGAASRHPGDTDPFKPAGARWPFNLWNSSY